MSTPDAEVAKRKIAASNEMMMEALAVLQNPEASREAAKAAEGLFHRARKNYEATTTDQRPLLESS